MKVLCGLFDKKEKCENDQLIFQNDESAKNSIRFQNIDMNTNLEVKKRFIMNLSKEHICEKVEGDLLIENLTETSVKLSGEISSLKIRNVSDSQIKLDGICNGSIYIESVKGGKLLIAGDQIRIHDSSNVDIILFSKNSCILENCENLRFYPNRSAAESIGYDKDDNFWKCIQDFGFNSENSFKLIDIVDE